MSEEDRGLRQSMLGSAVTEAVDRSTNQSERSRQAQARRLGVSDIGGCREYVRRVIVGEAPTQEPHAYDLAAFIGTAVGDHLENAFLSRNTGRGWVKQSSLTVELKVGDWLLSIPGHPDLYNRTDLIDFKTRDGLGAVRRSGPSDQERFQRALYAHALVEDDRMDPDCWVHNVYIDRSGAESEPVVWSAPYDPSVVQEAVEWLQDAIYAVEHGEEASRDKPREWCWAACPFAPACRGEDDTDAEGFTDDPILLNAVKVYTESAALIRAADKDKRSAASVLRDVSGTVGDHRVRWISVGPAVIPEQQRAGYMRLDIHPVAERKRPAKGRKNNAGDGSGSAGHDDAGQGSEPGPGREPGGETAVGSGPAQRQVPADERGAGQP